MQTFTCPAAGRLPALSWMELVSTLPKHSARGKPSTPSAGSRSNTLEMFLPSSHQIAPQLISTRVMKEPGISDFCPCTFPPPFIIDKKRSFWMVNQGSEKLIFRPILTSQSLISHVLAQNRMYVSNSQNFHTSKLNFIEFCVSVSSCSPI